MRGDCEIGERSRGKLAVWRKGATRYFFVQTRVASKRSRWESSRVEIKFAGKSEIYTVGRPLDLPVVWPCLSIFFPPPSRERELQQLRLFPSVQNFVRDDGFRWKEKNRRKETTQKKEGDSFRS